MDEIAPDNPCHASFSGTVSANTSLESNKDVYRSVYPASIINSIPANASPVVVTLPATQTYDYTSAVAKINNNYMAAYASVNRGASMVVFQFRNLCSILKVQVTAASGATGVDAQMSRLRFASANGLSGNFNVTFNNGIPSLTPVDASAGNVVEIIYSSPVDISTTKTFFVMLPPLSSEGLVMQVVNGDGTKVVQKEKASATLLRNKVYTTTINEPFGDWGGAISVSDNQRVYFAGGNLQHNFLHNTWRFAHEQYSLIDSVSRAKTVLRAATVAGVTWDVTGATDGSQIPMEAIAVNNVYPYLSNKAQWLKNQDIWTDLFSWGTAGLNTSGALNYGPFNTFWGWVPGANNNGAAWANQQYGGGFGPVGTNYTVYDFSEQHNYTGNLWDWSNVNLATGIPNVTQGACHALDADWGVVHRSELNNRITDASKRGDWRTLSGPEWNYVHYGTKRTEMDGKYKCGMGRIDTSGNGNYMNGVFLIPDKMHWYLMPPGTSFTPGTYTLWTTNTYTYAQFKRLENYGVVFLPAAGARTENIHHIGQIGFYWSSTSNPNT
ncbi:MAG: hypothetical protein IKX51_08850, partial [Bacteroidales bacterium]|nr:hypothetical protein [Bacteroidales bacterium]